MHDDALAVFLTEHPLKSKWLDDIVEALLHRPEGTAHVSQIGKDIEKERYIDSMDQTITRRINDYCSDAADFHKDKHHDLFERVAPATYRLRTYPSKPNLLELVNIEFDDYTMQGMWEDFRNLMSKKASEKWKQATNIQRLTALRKTFEQSWQAEFDRRKQALRI